MDSSNDWLEKWEQFLALSLFILGAFFWTYLWPALRIFEDGLRSGQLRGYVSVKSVNNGFVSSYTGGPLFDPWFYAVRNLILPALAVILFLISLSKILSCTSDVKSTKLSTREMAPYILCFLLSPSLAVYHFHPMFYFHRQLETRRLIEQSSGSSLHVDLVVTALVYMEVERANSSSQREPNGSSAQTSSDLPDTPCIEVPLGPLKPI